MRVRQQRVLKLRRYKGLSLRDIVDEINLSFATVRTILGNARGTDRTTNRHRERINIAPVQREHRARKRVRDRLPQQAQRVAGDGRAPIKEAKGPGR